MATFTPELQELRHRVEARRKRLEARLENLKADATGARNDAVQSIRSRLNELDRHLENGWENLTSTTVARINEWLKKSDE